MNTTPTSRKGIFILLFGFLVVLFIAALGLIFFVLPGARASSREPVPVKTLKPGSLFLGDFRQVQGTDTLIAEITQDNQSYGSARWFSYENGNPSIHNLVFMDGKTLASHRLFDSNANIITQIDQLPPPVYQDGEKTITVRCIIYQVAQKDTNQDGRLDNSDQLNVWLTDAAGNGQTLLLDSVDRVYWTGILGQDSLGIVYRQGETHKASLIDLNSRAITASKPLSDLGPEVK